MSDTDDWGPIVTTLSPPVDALATVTVGAEPLTTLSVPTGETLAIHVEADVDGEESSFTTTVETDEIPDPAFAADLDATDASKTVTVTADSWVTVTVGRERRLRFTASAGEAIAIYAERAEASEIDETPRGEAE